jgi:cephalosporin-C deacetylase-like acetyl esterase
MKAFSFGFLLLFNFSANLVSAQLPENLAAIFKYQRQAIPKYQVDSIYTVKDVVTEKVVFQGIESFKISAFITHPVEFRENRPFVLFNHWGEGDKNEFLQQARVLASRGFVCILIDGPWLCPDSPIKSFKNQGYEMYRQYVMNARSAIDLAQQHFKVNEDQIFCVGHSFGCNTAAILSAVDKRIDYFVFMAGVYSTTENITKSQFPDFVQWRSENPDQFKAWVAKMKPLDAEHFLTFKTAPCLIQVANKDEYISDQENDTFIRLTPTPKEIKIYDAGHALNAAAESDRTNWILGKVFK